MDDKTDLEIHLPGMNFCGPGTNLIERLEEDGRTPKAHSRPVDRVDEISLEHDLFYRAHKNIRDRCKADAHMIKRLKEIRNVTCRECVERAVVILCLSIKRYFVLLWLRLFQ